MRKDVDVSWFHSIQSIILFMLSRPEKQRYLYPRRNIAEAARITWPVDQNTTHDSSLNSLPSLNLCCGSVWQPLCPEQLNGSDVRATAPTPPFNWHPTGYGWWSTQHLRAWKSEFCTRGARERRKMKNNIRADWRIKINCNSKPHFWGL